MPESYRTHNGLNDEGTPSPQPLPPLGQGDDREGARGLNMPGPEPGARPPRPLGGECRGEGVFPYRNISRSRLQTSSRFSRTSLFQNRTTRILRVSNQRVRARSLAACWPPSTSTASRRSVHRKSTTKGPSECCRRNLSPPSRRWRRRDHSHPLGLGPGAPQGTGFSDGHGGDPTYGMVSWASPSPQPSPPMGAREMTGKTDVA